MTTNAMAIYSRYDASAQTFVEHTKGFNDDLALDMWMNEACQRVEMGWTSYWDNDINMFWINFEGQKVPVGSLQYGERNTQWHVSFLGHRFVLEDATTGELMDDHTITYEGFRVVGDSGSKAGKVTTEKQVRRIWM